MVKTATIELFFFLIGICSQFHALPAKGLKFQMPILMLRFISCAFFVLRCHAAPDTWVSLVECGGVDRGLFPVGTCVPWRNPGGRFSIEFTMPNDTHVGYEAYEGLQCNGSVTFSPVYEKGVCSGWPAQSGGAPDQVTYSILRGLGGQMRSYVAGTACAGDQRPKSQHKSFIQHLLFGLFCSMMNDHDT